MREKKNQQNTLTFSQTFEVTAHHFVQFSHSYVTRRDVAYAIFKLKDNYYFHIFLHTYFFFIKMCT